MEISRTTLNWALHYLSATFVAIVILAEPVSSGVLAYLLLGKAVTSSTAVDAAMVLAGIYVASRAELGALAQPGF